MYVYSEMLSSSMNIVTTKCASDYNNIIKFIAPEELALVLISSQ